MNMVTETKETTIAVCENFFKECEQHWLRDLKAGRVERNHEMSPLQQARTLALSDIKRMRTNPNSPMGNDLDNYGKQKVISDLTKKYELVHN